MNSKRLHLILLLIVALLVIGLVGGAYGANKLLNEQASKLVILKARSLALSNEQVGLNRAKKDIKKYADLEKIAHSVVPEDKNQAEAVREIVNIAAANSVTLAAISFPASSLGTGPAAVSPSAPAPAAASPSPSSTGKPNIGGLSQLLPVKSIPGVYQLLITVTGDSNRPVEYSKFINFLSDLEHNRRTAQVSTITIQPDTKNHDFLTFSLTLNEYIKP